MDIKLINRLKEVIRSSENIEEKMENYRLILVESTNKNDPFEKRVAEANLRDFDQMFEAGQYLCIEDAINANV